MAEETRARSTNSVLNFDAITAEEITNAAECVLWLLKGTGSDRDKQLTLAVLREWLQGHFGNTTINGCVLSLPRLRIIERHCLIVK